MKWLDVIYGIPMGTKVKLWNVAWKGFAWIKVMLGIP